MLGSHRSLCSSRQPAVSRLVAAISPALVALACGADAPDTSTAASGCEGDACSGGGALLEESLSVELSAEGAGTGQLRYVLRNDGPAAQRVLLRETPIGGGAAAFEVRRDGELVEYIGPHVTWASPSEADLATLEPGQEVSRTLNLTRAYDMHQPGEYSVKLLQLSGDTFVGTATPVPSWAAPALSDGAPRVAISVDAEHVTVPADGSVEKAVFIQIDPDFPGNCSPSNQRDVFDDEAQALQFLDDIISARPQLGADIASQLANQLFFANFNSSSFNDRTFILDTYEQIRAALPDTSYTCEPPTGGLTCTNPISGVTGDCCEVAFSGAVAVTSQPRNTILCPLYFDFASAARARFLIHETSHQAGAGGAKDPGERFNGVVVPDHSIHTAKSYEQYSDKCTFPSRCF